MNLTNLGVQELNAKEQISIDGGEEIHWWMYILSPAAAYIADKFLEGYSNYECE